MLEWADRASRPKRKRLRDQLKQLPESNVIIDRGSMPLCVLDPGFSWLDKSLEAALALWTEAPGSLEKALSLVKEADSLLRGIILEFKFKYVFAIISLWQRARASKQESATILRSRLINVCGHNCSDCLLRCSSCLEDHACCRDAWIQAGQARGWLKSEGKGSYTVSLKKTKPARESLCVPA